MRDFCAFRSQLAVRDTAFIPISALRGDNVVERSEAMPWYGGLPLLEHLETVEIEADRNLDELRFPVQCVIRDGDSDYRGYAGQVAGGVLRPGDEVARAALRAASRRVAAIDTYEGPLDEAFPPMSVTVRLADDARRLARRPHLPPARPPGPRARPRGRRLLDGRRAAARRAGATRSSTRRTPRARSSRRSTTASTSRTLQPRAATRPSSALNDIGRVRLRTSKPLAFDPYARNRATGSFILIDEATNDTVGAGMITAAVTARAVASRACAARRWCSRWRSPSPRCGGGKAAPQRAPRARARARGAPCAPAPTRAPRRRARATTACACCARTPAVTVHVPEGLRAGQRAPLVLGLHGAGQDARGFEGESGFTQVADEHHFVIAYPMSWRAARLLALPRARQPAQRPALPARDARRRGAHAVRRSAGACS